MQREHLGVRPETCRSLKPRAAAASGRPAWTPTIERGVRFGARFGHELEHADHRVGDGDAEAHQPDRGRRVGGEPP